MSDPAAELPTGAAELLSAQGAAGGDPLHGAGSERRFWRSSAGILSHTPDRQELARILAIGRALETAGAAVPRLIAAAPAAGLALHEDAGPDSLLSVARDHLGPAGALAPPTPLPSGPLSARVRAAYRAALDALATLQSVELPALALPPFGRDDLRWETWYGLTHHFFGVLGRAPRGPAIERELDELAATVQGGPQATMHRDFQSTNIHIGGGAVAILDWTGMRRGPAAYDLASLLWDPYVSIDAADRSSLLRHWGGPAFDDLLLRATVVQRLFQALGAFAYLSRHRGRSNFACFAAPAMDLLRTVIDPWPHLARLLRGEKPR